MKHNTKTSCPDAPANSVDRAIEALRRYCDRRGSIFDHPAPGLCEVTSRRVYLRNSHRELGRCEIRNGRVYFIEST